MPEGVATEDGAPAVLCRGLVKLYGEVVAVAGLDLVVGRGECFGLLGPNGAGKTTTVEILEGLLSASDGTVEIFGRRWETDEGWLRERIGVSLQTTHLQEKLTVRETITLFRAFFLEGRGVEDTLDLVALREKADARYETLSGGQKQRVAVACALAGKPDLLFLDEPTTGLDPQSRRALWDVIARFKQEGGSVLLTTHYMDEAEKLCDRVGIVDHGKMIACGTPSELIESLGAVQVVELRCETDEVPVDAVKGLPGVAVVRSEGGLLKLTVEALHSALPPILAALDAKAIRVTNLSTRRATLEDVFIELTGRHLRE